MLSLAHPWVLVLLPLAWLAWRPDGTPPLRHSAAVVLMPHDPASTVLDVALKLTAVLAISATVVGIGGPFRPEVPIDRVGQGAEIVLVLDRSRSMDQGFAGAAGVGPAPTSSTGPEALDYYARLAGARSHERDSKGLVARRLLAEFAARRPDDRFAMVSFSTVPMRILDFTQQPEVIQAAIAAGNVGRGLSETHIGSALQAGLSAFEGRPYTGSRIVLLVSDGGDQLDPDMREHLRQLVRKHRVGLYWIYLRSLNSAGLPHDGDEPPSNPEAVPEVVLHRYFESLGVPYRAYEAENPTALQKAIDDLDRLEKQPIVYHDTEPRRDLAPVAYGVALACVLLLITARRLEVRSWA
ncbi:vWA domain-containing protein [Ideonella sp. DXS29W]|uniref:VWA domain-containing protein n=1 Tax=Ideonella lacteola TaxID=2984193 RepID=A0ABU9BIJ7_9BURK